MPTCNFAECGKSAYFGNKDDNAQFCSSHRLEHMINVIDKMCESSECSKRAVFNHPGNTSGLYCLEHKENEMVNVKTKRCAFSGCYTTPITRNYKTKEKTVVDFVIQTFPHFTWITDKTIQDGCSKRRPDLLLDLGYQIIIIEIDENQHTEYDCSCENKRLMEISQDVGHRPIIFIRFNPDHYLNHNGLKIKSAWALNKLGIIHLVKTKMDEWTERLSAIKFQVEYWTQNNTNKTVEIIQLYYDEK